MNTYEQKLRDLEDRQRQVAADHSSIADEVAALREKLATPEPVVPWEPNAKGYFIFYQRLYKLAEECNAKHTAKHADYGYFHVFYSNVGLKWFVRATNNKKQEVTDLFTSESSAREACDIMNRDGWKFPTL